MAGSIDLATTPSENLDDLGLVRTRALGPLLAGALATGAVLWTAVALPLVGAASATAQSAPPERKHGGTAGGELHAQSAR